MSETHPDLTRGWQHYRSARYAEAEQIAAALLKQQPRSASALTLHAIAAWSQGKPIEGPLAEVQRAVKLAPDDGAIRHNLAALLSSNGDIAGGNEQYRLAIQLKPDDAQAFYALSMNQKALSEDDLVRSMLALHGEERLPPLDQELLSFALSKTYDDLGDYARSFAFAEQANAMGAKARPFRPLDLTNDREDLRRMAAADTFRKMSHASAAPDDQVLIVGMPRSGTTLVESILSRHPDVLAQGELTQIGQIEQMARKSKPKLGRYGVLPFLSTQFITNAAEAIARETSLRARGKPYRVATDKLPDNTLLLGLVSRVLPKARILYVRRHPLDVGLSNYLRRFTNGNAFSFTQDGIGLKTRVVAETMETWKQALDLPILDVSYEALVSDPEPEVSRMLDFLGLPWDAACLDPTQTGRAVLTASQWQVRQPINRGAIGRWLPYERYIGPMIEAMGGMAWIEGEVAAQASVASRSNSRA
ncbi:MAG: sulfotransferase [Devosia sp.]